ncbi:MAG: glutamate 5-kinase [Aquificae bacterium]|nr:glutamate 5-kinase [Aquificota bacterium]
MLVIVKIGSNLLQTAEGDIDLSFISSLAQQIKKLKKKGYKFVLVSSGAVLAGIKKLNLGRKPKTLVEKQALASIGQAYLMHLYDTVFANYNLKVSQVLLNTDVFKNRQRYENARNTFRQLLAWDIIPIVNENDTIAVEELIFGDNDFLAAYLSIMLNPKFVIVMSTAGGIYTGDPKDENSTLIREVNSPEEVLKFVKTTTSEYGSGGMKSKLEAAKIVHSLGIPLAIVGKNTPLEEVLEGKPFEGTLIKPSPKPVRGKKKLIAFIEQPKGVLYVDEGAKKALLEGKSLLAVGITKFEGSFERGDTVSLSDPEGNIFAKGKVNFSSKELKKIIGKPTREIEKLFPNRPSEVIHKDNLLLLEN